MDKLTRRVYLSELYKQSYFALKALESIQSPQRTDDTQEHVLSNFFSAHSFLIHVANISKLLSPPPQTVKKYPESEDVSRQLREMLSIEKTSPILDRTLRNHLEHFDERIHEMFRVKDEDIGYQDSNIGPLNKIKGKQRVYRMRHYIPETSTYIFQNERYNLKILENEVIKLNNARDRL